MSWTFNPFTSNFDYYQSGSGITQSAADARYLKLDGSNANATINIGTQALTTSGLGTFGALTVKNGATTTFQVIASGALYTYATGVDVDMYNGRVIGDTRSRIIINADGKIEWGDGSAVSDTNLYRSAANVLTTDDTFQALARISSPDNSVAGAERFGASASAGYNLATSCGNNANAGAIGAVAMGALAAAIGTNAIAIGNQTQGYGLRATSVGGLAQANYDYSIAIGCSSITGANSQFVCGSTLSPITAVFFGSGYTNATPLEYLIGGTSGAGDNVAGGNFVLGGGRGTGTGLGGSLILKVAPAGAAGSTLNALVAALTIDSTKLATFAGNVALGTNTLTLTGSIASTGDRVTKGWFTDLEVTNAIAGSITGNAAGLSAQYIDWSASSGGNSIANKPTIPGASGWTDNGATLSTTTDGDSVIIGGATAVGTSGTSVLMIENGTAPSTSPADSVQLYALDGTLTGTGGTITTSGGNTIHTFTSSGDFVPPSSVNATYLIVGGGGSGGHGANSEPGGGGGGGGVLTGTDSVTVQTYAIVVGAGGVDSGSTTANGTAGGNSSFNAHTAIGGAFGRVAGQAAPATGGSGGGGGGRAGSTDGSAGTSGQGYAGGTGLGVGDGDDYSGGGGGGASDAGTNSSNGNGGQGGDGISSAISGSSLPYADGGGGGSWSGKTAGASGSGGTGGTGGVQGGTTAGTAGTTNRGGGGGGGAGTGVGGAGGKGVVIISYPTVNSSELKVRDEAGNITTLSPHNFKDMPLEKSEQVKKDSDDMAWTYHSEKGDKSITVDMYSAIKELEKRTGKKFIYTNRESA